MENIPTNECYCGQVELLGTDPNSNVHFCLSCGKWVADGEEFHKMNLGAEILSGD